MLKEAEQHMKSLIEENEITQQAYQQSREIIENAQNTAKEIRLELAIMQMHCSER